MGDNTRTETISAKLRRIRLALVGITVAAGVLLITSTVITWNAVDSASTAIVDGQARALSVAVFGSLRNRSERPTAEMLDDIVDEHSEDGLLAIAVYRPNGKLEVSSSTDRFENAISPRGEPGVETLDDGNVRVVDRQPIVVKPDKRRRNRRARRGRNQRPRPRVRPGPVVVVDFEPVLAEQLRTNATRTLIAGGIAGIMLVVVALLLWRSLLAREQTERRLRDERHLASIGQMSATLAHEIRNPLASLKGHAQLLAAQLPEQSKEQRKAERLVSDVVRLEELTTGLLEFVKSNRIERTPVDVRETVESAIGSSGAQRVQLRMSGAPQTWELDRNRVVQALVNLIQNAAEASGEEPVEVDVTHRRGQLQIAVRDHGKGVPQDPEPLFEPFFTTRTRGTGLGLPMARQIARAHHGDVTAHNHINGGAVFEMRLGAA